MLNMLIIEKFIPNLHKKADADTDFKIESTQSGHYRS